MRSTETSASAPGPVGDDDTPYCANCGYALVGLTESSKCPECGRPLVEVLRRRGEGALPSYGKRYRSKATLFGVPVIDVALGPKGAERRGHARGIVAIGDVATGGLAVGGMATGVVAIGGGAVGAVAVGGPGGGVGSATGGRGAGGAPPPRGGGGPASARRAGA